MARGYRPGGVNPFVLDREKATFRPEFSWNYELGLKNKLWNNRAKINASVFYINYKSQQLFDIFQFTPFFSVGTANIGNSRNYGAELETELLLIRGLTLNANLGYLKTEFTDFKFTSFFGNEVDNKGNEQIFSPQWNGSAGILYNLKLTTKWKSSLAVDYQYQSDIWLDPENTAKQKAYGLLNARLAISNNILEIALWSKNLTNVTYLSSGLSIGASGIQANYGLPRTSGASVTVKF